MPVVVMGTAGSGKTTVGIRLAERLGAGFVDADSLHPPANVEKMSHGLALDDVDRWPWLAAVRAKLRAEEDVVVACSALARRYRDMLRPGTDVRFVFLDVPPSTAAERTGTRAGHFMGSEMVASQFATLERPSSDETDMVTIDATTSVDAIVDRATAELANVRPGVATRPALAVGGVDEVLSDAEIESHVVGLARQIAESGSSRVLLVPPDHTRLHSRAGSITSMFRRLLSERGCEVGVLPALGTHAPMDDHDLGLMFGDLSRDDVLVHEWRSGLRDLGSISADEVAVATEGRYAESIGVSVDAQLFDGWDLIVSIGQVVPHEVIGMANFTKNIVIGLGGAPTIHRSHFVGAVAGLENIMGRTTSPVRDVVDAAFDRFVAPLVDVMWVFTVVEDVGESMVLRGLFAGSGGTGESGGAAFRAAAELARHTNVDVVDQPIERVVCWLDPAELRSTWVGNKAVYRTRMAIADGGELVVLAPGVTRFGEDDHVDTLIRRHGYRGTPAALAALDDDPELAANLGAAAHLIHGSSESRFRIVYCTDPATGGLTQDEVESVGYEWRPLGDELERRGVDRDAVTGDRTDRDGAPFFFIANPAMGLWSSADRLERAIERSGATSSSAADGPNSSEPPSPPQGDHS